MIRGCWSSVRTSAAPAGSSASPTACRRSSAPSGCSTHRSLKRGSRVPRWVWRSPGGEASSRCSSTRSAIRPSSRSSITSRRCASERAGASDMPIVIRMPAFGGIKGKEHHGESPETFYVHTAGLKVVAPSGALDAYRLVAPRDRRPRPRDRARAQGPLLVEGGRAISPWTGPGIGEGRVLRGGGACTVFSYGAMVARCLEAAETAGGRGHRGARGRPAIALATRRGPDRRLRA